MKSNIKVVIFAGGLGTRLSEETENMPKPMVEIGGIPILEHIINIYRGFGFCDFLICAGYKSELIKRYFLDYEMRHSDVVFEKGNGKTIVDRTVDYEFKVRVIDTGTLTETGGRLGRIKDHLQEAGGYFLATYGDGVSDVDINAVVDSHLESGKSGTITAVYPPARFGALDFDSSGSVIGFIEKPLGDNGFINGGFGVFNTGVLDLVDEESGSFENVILEKLAQKNDLNAYIHKGFWHAMDTLRDKKFLNELVTKSLPWKK